VHGSTPFGHSVIRGDCVLGADGMIYGIGWPSDKSGFVAYRFDPETCETRPARPCAPGKSMVTPRAGLDRRVSQQERQSVAVGLERAV
jgi:hypothetical protein